nr:hypothetical protein [Tanacetum cinerariifolium]
MVINSPCCSNEELASPKANDSWKIINAVSLKLMMFGLTLYTKLKQRVRRLEKKRQFKTSGLKRLRKVGIAQRVESSADTVMDNQEDASNQGEIAELDDNEDVTLEVVDAEVAMDAAIQGRLPESQAKVYHLDLERAKKVLSMHDTDEAKPAEVEDVIEVVTAAKLMIEVVTIAATTITGAQVPKASAPRKRRGVVIQDPEETTTASVIMHSKAKSKDKGKVKRKEKQDNTVMRYQDLKRKPVTKAQARKNMMVYLKSMARFKMDFFRGMTYTDIRPIFEMHYNSIQAFLDKGEEEIREQEEGINDDDDDDDDVFTEANPPALKVPVVYYQIYHGNNKPFYKIIRADGTHKLFLSFITILKNFDREDLGMLWKLVQERFQSSEPKNILDDFMLNTLKTMFKNPNMFLLVEKKYPLTRFTLEQMLNNVRLEVEEESEMSLELLRACLFGWQPPPVGVRLGQPKQQEMFVSFGSGQPPLGFKNRPPMLNKENYVPWSSRILRYAKSRPNGKLIYNSIMNGPYVKLMILEPGDEDREVPVNPTFHEQSDDELTEKELKQIEAADQAI